MTPKNQASLAEVTFIVLDLETTGASPANGCAITEIDNTTWPNTWVGPTIARFAGIKA